MQRPRLFRLFFVLGSRGASAAEKSQPAVNGEGALVCDDRRCDEVIRTRPAAVHPNQPDTRTAVRNAPIARPEVDLQPAQRVAGLCGAETSIACGFFVSSAATTLALRSDSR